MSGYLDHWFMEHLRLSWREKNCDPSRIDDEACSVLPSKVIEEGLTKFVYSTIRSGMKIQYNGNLVIIGDVNPGAGLLLQGISSLWAP